MIIDPARGFWFGVGQGLFRVGGGELNAVMNGERTAVNSIFYGRDDGVPSVEFSFGFRGATARTADGHLWFATYSGALEIAPEKLRQPLASPPVIIEGLKANGVSVPLVPGSIELPPHSAPIQLFYTEPYLSAPERLRFRYRLAEESEKTAWIEAGAHRNASFPRLSAAKYRFEVESTDASGQWSGRPASLEFTVQAAWFETQWFRVGLGIAAAAWLIYLVRLIVHRRMKARIKRLEQEQAINRERTRIARDMHDELGANLTRIALMTDLATDEANSPLKTGEQLGAISDAVRGVVRTLDEIVWTINPRNDTLDRMVGYLSESARDFLSLAQLNLELVLPLDIPSLPVSSDIRHHILLVVKESLNNIVKYAAAKTTRLEISIEPNSLVIVIADGGKGFDVGMILESSNGLRNSRQRMESIGGSYSVESRPGTGTIVTLRLPLSNLELAHI
jgi:signal transduction histidine kinase